MRDHGRGDTSREPSPADERCDAGMRPPSARARVMPRDRRARPDAPRVRDAPMPPGRDRPYGTARPPPGGRHAPRHVGVGDTSRNHRVETDDGVPGCVALRRRDGALPEGEHDGSPHVAPRGIAIAATPALLPATRPGVEAHCQCAHSRLHASSGSEHAIRIGVRPPSPKWHSGVGRLWRSNRRAARRPGQETQPTSGRAARERAPPTADSGQSRRLA